ncbi:MAG TPA: class I adenylate-forming enzyme family protein [Aestuariivirgaceae bacterium]|jgi:fatty-acyl-CoA synthase
MSTPDHPWLQLEALAKSRSDEPALVFPERNRHITFKQWFALSARFAAGLSKMGTVPGDHVALLAENRIEWPVVQLATAALGAVLVPLNTHYRKDDLEFALKQSRARTVVLSRAFRSNRYLENVTALKGSLPDLNHVISLDESGDAPDFETLIADAGLPAQAPTETDVPAALLYTSGTTGFPKGAMLSHRAMAFVARTAPARLGLRAGDKWTSVIPLFHCAGCILNLLGCLHAGACYVGVSHFEPELMFKIIQSERADFFSGVPTTYLAMLNHAARSQYNLTSLKGGTCGGADCNPEVLRRCAEEFPVPGLAQVYGQTECATLFTVPTAEDPHRFDTAGLPLPGCELRIVDPDTGKILTPGIIGEIQGRGPNLMLGYHEDAEATALALTADGYLRTGDLGYITPESRLVIAGGRLKDMIIRGGENIYPAEIENLLQDHPDVVSAAVFGLPDEYYGEIVAAALMLERPVSAEQLSRFCLDHIAKFKVPERYFVTDVFPLTSSGKIRKIELKEWVEANRLEVLR